jgi:SAM-dependent methyltransferase
MSTTHTHDAYDGQFFDDLLPGALSSARVVVPILMELIGATSIIDVGCGLGAWLSVFRECGVTKILGVDGEYVDTSKLLIDESDFVVCDLARVSPQIDSRYDLALCLEVAEHLPATEARRLVRLVTTLAPLILFSAAIPGQGGINHINEQWPSYWRELFAQLGFRMLDPIRPHIRDNCYVEWWYRQNLTLYATPKAVAEHASLTRLGATHQAAIEWIHVSNACLPAPNSPSNTEWVHVSSAGLRQKL